VRLEELGKLKQSNDIWNGTRYLPACIGFSFFEVAYSMYDATLFVEKMDFDDFLFNLYGRRNFFIEQPP
jgi:hypothetical protein